MQPPHAPGGTTFPSQPTLDKIGRARWPFAFAWKTLQQSGVQIAFSSDWPVAPLAPMLGIKGAVTREPWGEGLRSEAVSLMDAVAGYTSGGAYAGFQDNRVGRLRPGLDADLVLLSADLTQTDAHALDTVTPRLTVCRGRVTFEA